MDFMQQLAAGLGQQKQPVPAANPKLATLGTLLRSTPTPQVQMATRQLYNELASSGEVPLDNPIMLTANPQLAQTLSATPESTMLNQLGTLLNQGQGEQAQGIYIQLADGGQVPLDDPTMLRANPGLAATLASVPQAAPQAAPAINPNQAWEMPAQGQAMQKPSGGATLGDMLMLMAPTVNPALGGPSGQNVLNNLFQSGNKPMGEQIGSNVRAAGAGFANGVGQAKDIASRAAVDTLGAFLYGLLGPADIQAQAPAVQQATPQPAPAMPQQAPVAIQPAPVAQQAAPQAAPVQAKAPGQVAPVSQGNVASSTDIVNALTQVPTEQASATKFQQTPAYQRPEFLTYLGDVLNGVAMNDNWAQGIAQGNVRYEQRGQEAAQRQAQNVMSQAQLAKLMSETNKNNTDATVSRAKAMKESDPNNLENQKTQAEIARIKAEQRLAEVRANYVGQEKQFTDANYATAYADVLKAEQEAYMMDPENSAYTFGPDFAARYKLNTISPNVARFYPMDGKTKQVLDSSMQQLQKGEITKEEFDSRLYQVQFVHGPESIRKYISGASNATTKPK